MPGLAGENIYIGMVVADPFSERMAVIEINGILERFGKMGEKSGWTYVLIPAEIARSLSKARNTFRVKGHIDQHEIRQVALVPVGDGDFILPVNGGMRKAIKKSAGAPVRLRIQHDDSELLPDRDFMECLAEEPLAMTHYQKLTQGHKNYFTKWIGSARTAPTKASRIAMALDALSRGLGFAEMLREKKGKL